MNYKVEFQETTKQFSVGFGEVREISDGGYEQGYEAGYEEGLEANADCVKSVNNIFPDENGNVEIEAGGGAGGTTEWKKIASIVLEEDVNSIEITTDSEGKPLDCSEIWAYFDSILYVPTLESGTATAILYFEINEKVLVYNGSQIGLDELVVGNNSNANVLKHVHGYNSLNGKMISAKNKKQGIVSSNVLNIDTAPSEKIKKVRFYLQYGNRYWKQGSTIVIYAR